MEEYFLKKHIKIYDIFRRFVHNLPKRLEKDSSILEYLKV